MHHAEQKNPYISVLNGELGDMGEVNCGICEFGLLHQCQQSDQEQSEKMLISNSNILLIMSYQTSKNVNMYTTV